MISNHVYEFGRFRLDPAERVLESCGHPVSITPKALDVLIVLIENHGRIIEREGLMRRVWPNTFVEDNNVAFNISVLRKLFGETSASSQYIETVPRRGYRFIAKVTAVPRPEAMEKESIPTEQDAKNVPGQPLTETLIPSMPVARPGCLASRDEDVRAEYYSPGQAAVCAPSTTGTYQRKMWAMVATGMVFLAGVGWLAASVKSRLGQTRPRVIVLIDTSASMGVYDPITRRSSGTNADDISDHLRDFPVVLQKESVGSAWDREEQVLKQDPDLIVIHLFAFFHAMNLDFQVGYPPFRDSAGARSPKDMQQPSHPDLFVHLLAAGQNRLEAFLGYAGSTNPKTRFLVYSRGRAGEWGEPEYRLAWVHNAERRFPILRGRVFTLNIEGGVNARFSDPGTVALSRRSVASILGLTSAGVAN